ncbi:hypothetical protein LOZ65_006034 [Ophidiomyces ophidiicola]|nr:hypothetical protein LOZ65_006034 [Ophidiomyces ophidiicola]
MEKYSPSQETLPLNLYRIDYPGSRTKYLPHEGLVAGNRTKIYSNQDENELKRDIVKQFTWGCRDALPFISLFSDREHAENWGSKQPWRGKMLDDGSGGTWNLFIIDTKLLDTRGLFRLEDLVKALGLELPTKAEQHIKGAYLCLHTIPESAIVEKLDPDQVQSDRYDRYLSRKYEAMERWDYLEGYSSEERESLQENWNTIFEKNLENAW